MSRTLIKFVAGVAVVALLPMTAVPAAGAPSREDALGSRKLWTQPAKPDQRKLVSVIPDAIPANTYCRRSLNRLDLFRNSSKFEWPSTLTILGETTTVDINKIDLFVGPFSDPSRRLWFRSMLWLAWRAALFAEQGNPAEAAVAARALVKAVTAYPDPGSSTPELLALSNIAGWDEGTVMRRAEALLCATSAIGVAEVAPALRSHAAVLLDPNRYVGPPQRPVHNHGLLANLTLLDIADVLNDPAIRDAAVGRLSAEYPQAFTAAGWAYESSSHYHGVNYLGWTEAMFALQQRGFSTQAAGLQQVLQRAATVSAHLIGPTGTPVMIGNSRGDDTFLRPKVDSTRPLTLVDAAAGIAFGRFSWTDPDTTSWTAMNRPRKGAHGHDDRLSLTWQTGGTPVLIDPGQPDYELSDPLTAWSKSAAAHNTAIPAETKKDRNKIATTAVRRSGQADQITMTSTHSGFLQKRDVYIDHQRRSMWVSDVAPSALTQNWHFAPGWSVVSITGSTATLRDPKGRTLTVTASPGATITPYSGSTAPTAGWYAEAFERSVPALQLAITGGKALDTLFIMGNGTAPEDVRLLNTEPSSRKIALEWSPPTPPEPKKGSKRGTSAKKSRQAEDPASVKIKGYRLQVKLGSEAWRTVIANTKSRKTTAVIRNLKNGQGYRFRVAALAKTTQTGYSRPSSKLVPFTTPGPVSLTVATATGSAKKPQVSLGWLPPANDGGARVTGYEVKLPPEALTRSQQKKAAATDGWVSVRRPAFTVPMAGPQSKSGKQPKTGQQLVVLLRAVNKGGGGDPIRLKLSRLKSGAVLVNGKELAPVVPVPPTAPPTAPPAAPPVLPEAPDTPDPDAGAPVTAG